MAGLLPLHPTAAASPYTAAGLLDAAAGGWMLLYFVMVAVLQSRRHKAAQYYNESQEIAEN